MKHSVVIGAIGLVLCLLVGAYALGRSTPITDVQVIPHPLMDAGGFATPETGNVKGIVSIVRSQQSFSKSAWELIIDRWAVFEPYTSPILTYDRTASNHTSVTWNVLDAAFIVIDEGTFIPDATRDDGSGSYTGASAVLIYSIDGKEYLTWTENCHRAPCYGGTDKWFFGGTS